MCLHEFFFFDSLKNNVMIWSIYSNFDCCGTSRKQVVVNYFIVCSTVNQRNKQTKETSYITEKPPSVLKTFPWQKVAAFSLNVTNN